MTETSRRELLLNSLKCTPALITVAAMPEFGTEELQVPSSQLVGRNLTLSAKLRAMDRLIIAMSQETSWEGMQPYFAGLIELASGRQITESNRINTVVENALLKVYGR